MSNPFVYAIQPDGKLLWYRHDGQADGTFVWQGPKEVGTGWGDFAHVFAAGDGVLYAIHKNGDLMWYRHNGQADGSSAWANAGLKVGSGWNGFSSVFSGGDGVIYAVEQISRDPATGAHTGGHLIWYRHDGWHDGSPAWSGPKTVGNGWNGLVKVFSGGDSVIYGIQENGDLLWYRHDGRNDGSFVWGPNVGKKVGSGWNGFSTVFSGGDGIIYGIQEASRDPVTGAPTGGHLMWYRHDGRRDGSPTWSGPMTVGNGWGHLSTVFCGGAGYHVYGAIGEKYTQLGGLDSWLGMPTSDEQPFDQGGRVSTFEHGAIYWWPDTGAIELGDIVVRYRGLYCFSESDSDQLSPHDEPYAIMGIVSVVPREPFTAKTPIYDEVDSGDSRVDNIELYRGLPYGLSVTSVIMEHDYSDPNQFRELIQKGVVAASAAVSTALVAVPAIGPLLSLGAAALLAEVGPAITDEINSALDLADDFIGQVFLVMTPKDLVTRARSPLQNQQGILWHMDSPLAVGDGANYKVYFSIEPA